MATHNVSGTARLVGSKAPRSNEDKLVAFLGAEENKPLASLFYLGALSRLYEDYDYIDEGIKLAEECIADGQTLDGADPMTLVKQIKVEQKKVKDFIELVIKCCPLEVEIERRADDSEGST